jgi:2,4-dienoyl-CoA reductase-like NADH-dependent reductase (Old Yellow Enzyme family)
MAREWYRAFSPGTMGSLTVPNRLVRSATWDGFHLSHSVTEDHLDVYKELAAGGVGTITR